MTEAMRLPEIEVRDPAGLRAKEAAQEQLANAVRELLDATIRTKAAPEALSALTEQVRGVSSELLADAHPGPLGLRVCSDGRLRDPGNPAVGRRNPVAPPIRVRTDRETARVTASFNLGAPYEGPPGHVHGGMLALVLDQVLGTVPALVGRPGMTAYLNVIYRRPSPLREELCAEAWVDRQEGWKTYVKGHILNAEGQVTAEAEGLFVVPRFAREQLSRPMSDAGEYDARGAGWFPPA